MMISTVGCKITSLWQGVTEILTHLVTDIVPIIKGPTQIFWVEYQYCELKSQYTINEYLEQNGAIPCGQLETAREEVIRNSLCPGTYIVVLQCHKTYRWCPIAYWHFVNSISQSTLYLIWFDLYLPRKPKDNTTVIILRFTPKVVSINSINLTTTDINSLSLLKMGIVDLYAYVKLR